MGDLAAGLRLAASTLTITPLQVRRADRRAWGVAMASAPFVGLLLAAVVVGLLYAARWLWGDDGIGALIAAAVCVAVVAALTRGLHLDGLADTVDGLGCTGDHARRLAVMREPHVGAFGVTVVILVLMLQTLALARSIDVGMGVLTLVAGVSAGRLAVTWSCTRGVPSARDAGLGAQVAGTVAVAGALASTILVVGGTAAIGLVEVGAEGAARSGGAVAAALVVGWLVRRAAVRRLGGITGDVLGAVVELSTLAAWFAASIRAT